MEDRPITGAGVTVIMLNMLYVAGVISFVATLVLLPLVRHGAEAAGLYDVAGPLKLHTQKITRFGGVAMLGGLLTAGLAGRHEVGVSIGFYLGLIAIWLVALIDDFRGVSPLVRLLVQLGGGAILWCSGLRLVLFHSSLLGFIAIVVCLALFINAFNMLDGADGLAAGVSGIIACGFIALNLLHPHLLDLGLAVGLLGACAAFLIFNFYPAKMFMGDCGSTMLGFILGFLTLHFWCRQGASSPKLLIPLLFAGLPLVDAGLAIVRRLARGASPFQGDRGHLYDLLLQRGWSVPRIALCCYGVTTILVLLGLAPFASL